MNPKKHAIPTRAIKLGGSLLDWPHLTRQLSTWLDQQTPARNLMLIGGGDVVEAIRKFDAVHRLGQHKAHRHCIHALRITEAVFGNLFPMATPAPRAWDQLPYGLYLLSAEWIVEEDRHRSARPLPEHWDVTTDSLAARAAVLTEAAELVLLKSKAPDRASNLGALADTGYVDRHFPICAAELPRIRFVDLRDPDLGECAIVGNGRQPDQFHHQR